MLIYLMTIEKQIDIDEKATYVLHYFIYQFDGTNFVYKKKE